MYWLDGINIFRYWKRRDLIIILIRSKVYDVRVAKIICIEMIISFSHFDHRPLSLSLPGSGRKGFTSFYDSKRTYISIYNTIYIYIYMRMDSIHKRFFFSLLYVVYNHAFVLTVNILKYSPPYTGANMSFRLRLSL